MFNIYAFIIIVSILVIPLVLNLTFKKALIIFVPFTLFLVYNLNVNHEGNGASVVFGMALLSVVLIAILSGFLAKLLLFFIKTKNIYLKSIIIFIGVSIIPFLIFSYGAWDRWNRMTPPPSECLSSKLPIIIGNNNFYVPILNNITLNGKSNRDFYFLWSNKDLRKICKETENGKKQFKLTNIHIDLLKNISNNAKYEYKLFKFDAINKDYPVKKIHIFSNTYNYKQMFAVGTYDDFLKDKKNIII